MREEIDDIERDDEFEQLLAQRRHNEVIAALQDLAVAVTSDSKSDKVINAINSMSESVKAMMSKDTVVNVDQDKVVLSVKNMGEQVLKGLNDLKELESEPEEKKVFIAEVTRDRGGYIDSIKFTQK